MKHMYNVSSLSLAGCGLSGACYYFLYRYYFKPANGPTVEYRKKLRVMISKTVMGFNVVLLQFNTKWNV